VAYLQVADPELLLRAPGTASGTVARGAHLPASSRRLWATVALLLIFTPLGILATGKAWGEWAPSDFVHPQARAQIAAASQSQEPVSVVPTGVERMATIWTSPFPAYAPGFVKSRALGYLLSAMFGVGICLLIAVLARARSRVHVHGKQTT
jgi:cobalt/nickel transport system permease protein